jgi:hypothetical protein
LASTSSELVQRGLGLGEPLADACADAASERADTSAEQSTGSERRNRVLELDRFGLECEVRHCAASALDCAFDARPECSATDLGGDSCALGGLSEP